MMNSSFDKSDEIARLASALSDATRIKILMSLLETGNGMTTMDISTKLDVLQPRISSHLSILRKNKLVIASRSGRQQIYSVNSKWRVSSILRDLLGTLPNRNVGNSMPISQDTVDDLMGSYSIRHCRTCYDHLAGVVAVKLLKEMIISGWLQKIPSRKNGKVQYALTRLGSDSLSERGVKVEKAVKSKRNFAFGCIDWTEREPHLGGSLGRAILDSLISNSIVERRSGTRALKVVKPISDWLNTN